MSSPFRRRQQMVRGLMSGTVAARAPVLAEPAADTAEGQEYAALRVQLHDNLRSLSDIQSHEDRLPKKREFSKAFAPWIDGVIEAGKGGTAAQDEIVATNLIWAIDYGDFDRALDLGVHVIAHGLTLPESYKRSPACFLAEDIAEEALKKPDAVSHEQLLRLATLVDGRDMPDPVKAKLAKAIGRSFAAKADAFDPAADNAPAGGKAAFLTEALAQYRRALTLDKNAGVKKAITAVEAQLKAAGAPRPDTSAPRRSGGRIAREQMPRIAATGPSSPPENE